MHNFFTDILKAKELSDKEDTIMMSHYWTDPAANVVPLKPLKMLELQFQST